MPLDRLASLTGETAGQRVLIVSADAVRASRLARAVALALGEGAFADVLVRTTLATAHAASTIGLDLCLFDLGDGELDVAGCVELLHRRRARRVLVVSREALTSFAIEAVRAGAFGYQPFDDQDGDELVAAAVRDALGDDVVVEADSTGRTLSASVAHELNDVFAGMLDLLTHIDRAFDHDSALEDRLAELRRSAERGVSLLGANTASPAPLAVTEPGSGTSFEILLQRANETTGPDSVPAPSTGTVLLVEDDGGLRGTYAELLQTTGCYVITSQDGFSALLAASTHSGAIHVLITEVILPQMSGIELWRKLSRFRPEMRVLFLTGNTQQARTLFGKDIDGPAILSRPFGTEVLGETVRDLLATHPFLSIENREIA